MNEMQKFYSPAGGKNRTDSGSALMGFLGSRCDGSCAVFWGISWLVFLSNILVGDKRELLFKILLLAGEINLKYLTTHINFSKSSSSSLMLLLLTSIYSLSTSSSKESSFISIPAITNLSSSSSSFNLADSKYKVKSSRKMVLRRYRGYDFANWFRRSVMMKARRSWLKWVDNIFKTFSPMSKCL